MKIRFTTCCFILYFSSVFSQTSVIKLEKPLSKTLILNHNRRVLTCISFFGITIKVIVKWVLYTDKHLADLVCETIYSVHLPNFYVECVEIEHTNGYDISVFLMDHQISAVLSVVHKLNCSAVQKAKKVFPFFNVARSLDSCNRHDQTDYFIDLFPSNLALVSAMTNTAAIYGWKEAVVFEKHSKEVEFSFSDLQYSRDHGMETLAFKADSDEESLRNTLQIARKAGIRAYVLSSSVVDALSILKVANSMQLVNQNFHWFIPNVFVDPLIFEEIASTTGVEISILSSPLITPIATSLLNSYDIITNSSEETADRLYYDVVKSLTRLVVSQMNNTCRKLLSQGYLHDGDVCSVNTVDISVWNETFVDIPKIVTTTAPVLTTEDEHGHERRKRDEYSTSVENKPKRMKSKIMAQGRSRGKRASEFVAVNIGNRDNLIEASKDQQSSLKSRKRRTSHETACVFPWPDSVISTAIGNISQLDYKKTGDTFRYTTSVDLCGYERHLEWLPDDHTMSSILVNDLDTIGPTSIYVVEIIKEKPVIIGYETWSTTELNIMYHPFSQPDVTLPKRPLRLCAVWHIPWLSWATDEKSGNTTFEGFLYNMVIEISHSMNFSYEIVVIPSFPKAIENSEVEIEEAMYHYLEKDTCDLFLYAKGVRGNRLGKSGLVYLSIAYQQPSMYLITQRIEKEASVDIWQFMTPFHVESWLYLWSTLLLVSLYMAWLNKRNPNEYQKIAHVFGPNSTPADHLGILNSLWFNFGSLVQQGVDIVPRSKALKILTASWWIFCLTIITAYTANMTLFMTQNNNDLIETLEKLANQKEFGYGIMYDNPMLNLFLPHAKERPYTTLYNYFKRHWNDTVFYSHDDAFEKLEEGDFYLLSSFETAVEALQGSCRFDKVGTGFYKYQFALPFPSGSLIIPLFNDHIARLRDRGILKSLENKWFSLEVGCEKTESKIDDQLELKSFVGMYVFLIIGCFLGIIICTLETGWVTWGGLGGIFGKANHYEFQENRRDKRQDAEKLEEEFTGWRGGWGVWKFKEWNKDNPNLFPELTDVNKDCCEMCGKTNVGSNVKKVKKEKKQKMISPAIKKGDTVKLVGGDSGMSSADSSHLKYDKEPISSNIQVISVKPLAESPPIHVPKPLPGLQPMAQPYPVVHQEASKFSHPKTLTPPQRESTFSPRIENSRKSHRTPSILSTGSHSSLASTAITWSTCDWSTRPSSINDVTSESEIASPPPPCGFEDDDDEWTDEE